MFRTQKDTIRKVIQNNAGFTLIEMIVTVAIIAIFSGVVVTLIGTGSNLFRGVSGNTKSQIDAQETLNAIEDLIIDANRSVYYAYGSGTAMGEQIRSDIDDSNAASKTFITCNEYENGDGTSRYVFDVLDWVGSEGKLYYSQRQYTKASSSAEEKDENESGENLESQQNKSESGISGENAENIDIAIAAESDEENQTGTISGNSSDIARDSEELIERSVFAEGIENFTADVTKVESERIVRFRLTTENNGKKVKTLHTVNLRNRIQVLKPDDAFATAGSTDIRITIVGAPNSIDAGNSKILSYDASGPIDPTTVVWKITDGADKGSFPALDSTYGKLTVNNNATGTITVTVSARTADGKQTATSAPVTIQINNNRIVTGIETETKSVLVAAGYNGLNLNSEIIWKYVYSDGTKGEDNVPVSWTMDKPDNCSYANVTSAGQISVDSEAGTSDKGSFTVRATNSEHNVSNTITVKIARIDIVNPESDDYIFYVGEDKKLEYIYMEGGNSVPIAEADTGILTINKPGNAENYIAVGKFTDGDIGKWEVRRTVDLTVKREGYGIVEDTRKFEVKNAKHTGEIVETAQGKYVFGGRDYACGEYNDYSIFKFQKNWSLEKDESYTLTWYLEGKTSDDTKFMQNTETFGKLIHIGENERGFILKGVYVRKDKNGNEIETIVAEKSIPVISNIRIDRQQLPEEVKIGNTYILGIRYDVGRAVRNENGTIQHTKVEGYTDNRDEGTKIYWQGNIDTSDTLTGGYQWKVTSLYQSETQKNICVIVNAIAEVFRGSGEYNPKAEVFVNIVKPTVSIDIKGVDVAYTNEKINMWAQVTVDGIKKENLNVKWYCHTIGWNADSLSNNNSTAQIEFKDKGTYSVSVNVVIENMNFTEAKTLTINEHLYEATIKSKKPGTTIEVTSAKPNEIIEFYLEVKIDGIITNEYQAEWTAYCSNPENDRSKKTFRCIQNWTNSYLVTAAVTFTNGKKIYPDTIFKIE